MHLNALNVDSNLQSRVDYGSFEFPLEVFLDDLCKYDIGFIRWHWHKEVEFVVVKKGVAKLFFLDNSIELSVGEGVFVNSNSLHQIKPVIPGSTVVSIVFDSTLVSGHRLSTIDKKYVSPVLDSGIEFLLLESNMKWSSDIITKLLEIYNAYENGDFGYELSIKNSICSIWLALACNAIPNLSLASRSNRHQDERIKTMLEYVHSNFSSDISLGDIADTVNISKSECCRCFKKHLNTSPFKYLMQYRIVKSLNLLKNTDKPVTEIMSLVGFNDASYFSKIFKRFTNKTPFEYRKQLK